MSAIPAILPEILHYKGSDFNAISIKYNFDMTGYSFLCQIKPVGGGVTVHEWKTGVNITVVNAAIGHIILNGIYKFKPAAGNYIFDIETDNPLAQKNQSFIRGSIKVIQDISNPTV